MESKNKILEKYSCKARILFLITPNYKSDLYKKYRDNYEKNSYEFHKYHIKKITLLNKNINEPYFELFDLDGKNISIKKHNNEVKSILDFMNRYDIFAKQKSLSNNSINNKTDTKCKEKPLNLSLYSDYNPETTIPNLGFKDEEKALYTIKKIKNKSVKYQIGVLNTLIGRAKSHPYQTADMRKAIKILEKYKKKLME